MTVPKSIPHTQEDLQKLLKYDKRTGAVTWRRGRHAGRSAGYEHVQASIRLRLPDVSSNKERLDYPLHRIIWKLVTGEDPTGYVDHIDGNPLNNSWDNLRCVTKAGNAINPSNGRRVIAKSGVRGVRQLPSGRWQSYFGNSTRLGGFHSIGVFDTKREAVAARKAAEQQHYGDDFHKKDKY